MKKRFTLTEVLVVVFLIGVLTAIGFGMYSYAMNSAKESATRALFSRLNAALESCNTKFGYIPQSDGNDFSTIYVKHFTDTYTVPGNSGEEKEIGYIIGFEGEAPTVPGDSKEKQNLALWMEEFMKTIDLESLRKNLDNNGRLVDVAELSFKMMQYIVDRITHEVPGVNRVLWDLTPKPTGTIEWE